MRLLYITNGINGSGGLERVLSIKASALADEFGHEVHILTLNNQNQNTFFPFSDLIFLHDIKVNGNPLRYIKSYVCGIKSVVNTIQPDCISVCDDGLKAFFIPIILGKKRPIIYERHVSKNIEIGHNPSLKRRLWTRVKFALMGILAKNFTKFILLTKANALEWRLPNLEIISNPLSFYPEKSSLLEEKVVIAVGKQSFQKGYDRLLLSWQLVVKKCPDWQLTIYGKKDSSQNLEQLAKELGIEDSVNFFEPEREIQQKYLASSIYAFPSRFEGFGMVLIEAMACGLPCVSYDCPHGPSDIISDGEDGFLIENGNVSMFADKLLILMQNESLRKEMGFKAKKNVLQFKSETIVKKWDELFKSFEL